MSRWIRKIGRAIERVTQTDSEGREPVARLEALEDRVLLSAVVANDVGTVSAYSTADSQTINLFYVFDDSDAIYRFTLGNSVGTEDDFFDVDLYQAGDPNALDPDGNAVDTSGTVANFRRYADMGLWDNTLIHRVVSDFVVQGGGFDITDVPDDADTVDRITQYDPIDNEAGVSNTRGTIAMAKLGGDPDSATNQWFFNLGDNSTNLDAQNGGFTAFGEVVGDGMDIIDAIAALNTADVATESGQSAFTDTPVLDASANPLVDDTNMVLFSSIREVLTFTVSSSDDSVVTATLGDDGQLVLDFQDGNPGTATITVTAQATNGAELTYQFDVVTQGPDLQVSSALSPLAPRLSPGETASTPADMLVRVENISPFAMAAGETFDVSVILRPTGAADSSEDIVIGTQTYTVGVGGLGTNDVISGTVSVVVPAGLEGGSYDVIAVVDPADELADLDESNHEYTFDVLSVTDSVSDVELANVAASLSSESAFYTQSDSVSGTVSLLINNLGVALTGTHTLGVALYLRPQGAADNSQDLLIRSTSVDLVDLYTDQGQTYVVETGALPAVFTPGNYRLVAKLDPDGVFSEDTGADDNNVIVTADSVFSVLVPQDLSVTLDGTTVSSPITVGDEVSATVDVTIRNILEAIDAGVEVDVEFLLRPVGATDGSTDVTLQRTTLTLGALGFGESQSFTDLDLTIPDTVPAGTYNLVAILDPEDELPEYNETNNESVLAGDIVVEEEAVTQRLTGSLSDSTFPEFWVAGRSLNGTLTLSLTNSGDIIAANTTVKVRFELRNATDPDDAAQIVDVQNLTFSTDVADGETVDFTISLDIEGEYLNLSGGIPGLGKVYKIVAVIDPELSIDTDPDLANHEAVGEPDIQITVGPGERDLVVSLDGNVGVDDGSVIDVTNGASGTLDFTVTNFGTTQLGAGFISVGYRIVLRPSGATNPSSNDIVLVSELDNPRLDLQALNPDDTYSVTGVAYSVTSDQLDLGNGSYQTGLYDLVLTVNNGGAGEGGLYLNNSVVVASVRLASELLPDVEIADHDLPERIGQDEVTGQVTVDLINEGVAIPAGTDIDITVELRGQSGTVVIGSDSLALVADLLRGAPLTRVVNVTIPAGTTLDTYSLAVSVSYVGLGEDGGDLVKQAVISQAIEVFGGPDLTGQFTDLSNLPAYVLEGTASGGHDLSFVVHNELLDITAGTSFDYRVVLRPTAATDSSGDVEVGTGTLNLVGGLAAGATTADQVVTINIPDTPASGAYRLLVLLDTGGDITEHTETNNTVVGPTLEVVEGPDLSGTFFVQNGQVSGFDHGAGGTIRTTLDILVSSIDVPGGQADITVTFGLRSDLNPDGAFVVLVSDTNTISIAGASVGDTISTDVNLTLPAGTDIGTYEVVAFIDSSVAGLTDPGDLQEADETNNAVSGVYVSVGAPEVENAIDDITTSASASNRVIDLYDVFKHATNQYILSLTNPVSGLSEFTVRLLPEFAANTASVFQDYADSGIYDHSFFQHLYDETVEEGDRHVLVSGGYVLDPASDQVQRIANGSLIESELALSNTRGTIAWLTSGEGGGAGSTEWFINTEDNSAIFDENVTAFGRVIRGGMDLVDAVMGLTTKDLGVSSEQLFQETPVINDNDPVDLPNDLVLFDSVREALTFEIVSNSDAGVVTAEIVDGRLVLDYVNGASGTSTITLRATDNDGQTVETAFTVTTSPQADLSGSITQTNLEADARRLYGQAHRIRATLQIRNISDATALDADAQAAVTFVLRPEDASNDLGDVFLKTVMVDVSGLAAGGTLDLPNLSLTIPDTVVPDRYNLVAIIDSASAVQEADESNNEATVDGGVEGTIEISGPTADLGIQFGSRLSLPDGPVISGDGTRLRVPIEITQLGTGRLRPPSFRAPVGNQVQVSRQVLVTVYARPVGSADDSQDVPLTVNGSEVAVVTVVGLGPDQTRRMMLNVELPPEMDAGDYRLVAIVDSGEFINEANVSGTAEDNNTVVTSDDGFGRFSVVKGFVNLSPQLTRTTMQANLVSSDRLRGFVLLKLNNDGNIATDRFSRVSLELTATAPDDTVVVLGTVEELRIGRIAAGGSKLVRIPYDLVEGLPADYDVTNQNWTIEVAITDLEGDVDNTDGDDTDSYTVNVANRSVDLEIELDDTRFQTSAQAGDLIRVPVTITNTGSDAVPVGARVEVRIYASSNGVTRDALLLNSRTLEEGTEVVVSNLAGGRSRRAYVTVMVPPGGTDLPDGSYFLIAEVDPVVDGVDQVDEWDGTPGSSAAESTASNSTVSGRQISITTGTVDLAVSLDRVNLPLGLQRGDAVRGSVQVVIANLGEADLLRGQRVNIEVYLVDESSTEENPIAPRLIGTLENTSVSGLRSGQEIRRVVRLNRPEGVGRDGYWTLQATVTPVSDVDEVSTANNSSSEDQDGNTVHALVVGREHRDLKLDLFRDVEVPASVTAGSNTVVRVPVSVTNIGNTAFELGSTASFKVTARLLGGDSSQTYTLPLTNGNASYDLNISRLRVGQTRNAWVSVMYPAGMPTGQYQISVEVASDSESGGTGLVGAPVPSANNTVSLGGTTVTRDNTTDLDVLVSRVTDALPSQIEADTAITAGYEIEISNSGTSRIGVDQTVDLRLYAVDTSGVANDVAVRVLTGIPISGMLPGQTITVTLNVAYASGLDEGDYRLELEMSTDPVLAELTTGRVIVGQPFEVIAASA